VDAGMAVTLLSRDPSKSTKSFPDSVKVLKTDYSSIDSILPSLKNQDAVVDLINRHQSDVSIRLIDAAIAAGISHYIPSAFGVDQKHPYIRTLPPVQDKVKMEEHLEARAAEGKITFTAIETSMFLEYALNGLMFPLDGGTARLYNGGTTKVSMTCMDDIGIAVATALLKRDDEKIKNGYVFTQSCSSMPRRQHPTSIGKLRM
jgi:saccharopine dehydrogenase-like NADP-dependent oxidoreductase